MRLLSSAFLLSTRDGYHEPSNSQHDTANKISLISIHSVTMKPLSSSSFPLSTLSGHHQSSSCQNETAVISLLSVNKRQLSSAFPLSTRDGYHQSSSCQNETAIISLPSINMTSLTKSESSDDPCQHDTPSEVSIRAQIQLSMYDQNLSAAFRLIFLNPFSSTADICNCQLRLSAPSDMQSITITLTIFGTTLIRPVGVCNTEINTLMLMKCTAPTFCVLSFRFSKRSIIYDNSNSICNKHCMFRFDYTSSQRFVTILIEYCGPHLMPGLS